MKISRIREFKNFCLAAAILVAGASLASCSSSDDIAENNQQPVNPTAPKTYTNDDLMEKHVLYLLDKGPNNKGKILMTRINDHFMEKLLREDPVNFELYYGRGTKGQRQSASNILPILVKKGLIGDYYHQKE